MKRILSIMMLIIMTVITTSNLTTVRATSSTVSCSTETENYLVGSTPETYQLALATTVDGNVVSNTYCVQDKSDLIALATYVNGGDSTIDYTFLQTKDIDLNSELWTPIGKSSGYQFEGNYNGSGLTISNLYIDDTDTESKYFGLFGRIDNAKVEDLTLSGVYISRTSKQSDYTGSIIGYLVNSTVSGVTVTGNIHIEDTYSTNATGGLVGYMSSSNNGSSIVSNSHINTTAEMVIESSGPVGGFAGLIDIGYEGTSTNIYDSTITNTDILTVTGTGKVGGFVANMSFGAAISNSSITTSGLIVEGSTAVGGFVGQNGSVNTDISNSFINTTSLNVSGKNQIGGFIGYLNLDGTVTNSYITATNINLSDIDSATGDYIGGFMGADNNRGTVQNIYIAADTIDFNSTSSNINSGLISGRNLNTINSGFIAVNELTGTSSLTKDRGTLSDIYYFNSNGWSDVSNTTVVPSDTTAIPGTTSTVDLIDTIFGSQSYFTDSGLSDISGYVNGDLYAPILLSFTEPPEPLLDYQPLFNLRTFAKLGTYGITEEQISDDSNNDSTSSTTEQTVSSSSSYSIKTIPLEETHHIDLDTDGMTTEIGYHIDLPTFTGYKLYGYYETDLTDQVEITGTYDIDKVGVYKILYTLTAYNERNEEYDTVMETFTLTVVDTTPPVITGDESVELFIDQDLPTLIEVSDNSNGDITVTQDKEIDNTLYGEQMITYTAVDESGNSTSFTQAISFRYPKVKQEIITINNQSFVFVLNEKDNDLDNPIIEYAVVKDEVTDNTVWSNDPLEASEGEKVVVRLLSTTGTVLSTRETIVKPVTSVVEDTNEHTPSELDTEAVIEPNDQPSNNTGLIIGILGGFIVIATGWWFLLGKRRKDDDEEETK